MQEPYKQGRAYQFGPESCVGSRKGADEALTGGSSGQPLSSEIITLRVPITSCQWEGYTFSQRNQDRELTGDATESETLCMNGHLPRGNREILEISASLEAGRSKKARCRNVGMYVSRRSDSLVVPEKRANNAGRPTAAEFVEERGLTKENAKQLLMVRTQSRDCHVARTVWDTNDDMNWSRRLAHEMKSSVIIQGKSRMQ